MNELFHKMIRKVATIPRPAVWSLLLTISVALLFAPAVNFEFLYYDDPINVYKNRLITHFVPAKLARIWGGPILGLYIPLTYTVWAFLGRLAAWLHPANNPTILDPAVFHAANIVVHAMTVLVVFAILRLLLKRDWPAAGGALLFALHPVQVGPVAWVSELKGLLGGLLGLLAIWQYLRYAITPPTAPRRPYHRYLAATCLFIAALLAKPSVVSIPLMAAVLAVVLVKRDLRRVVLELSPWVLLAIPLIIITKEEQPSELLSFVPNLWQRFLVAGDAITFYHTKLLWPFRLSPDYGRDPQEVLASNWVYLTGLLPYAVGALLFWRIRRPWLVASALVFVAALLPVLGFIPFGFQSISTVANRYLHLAMLAPAMLLGRILYHYPGRRMAAATYILLVFLAFRGADRLSYWRDSLTFNLRTIEINPDSCGAYNNLGVAYEELGRSQEGAAAFSKALACNPDRAPAYANLGRHYAINGYPDEAKTYYLKALERHPLFPEKLYLALAILARDNGRPTEALDYSHKALAYNPRYALAYASIGLIYKSQGQFDAALANYRKAIEIDPYQAGAHVDLGHLYEIMGHKAEAESAYRQAIWLQPEDPDAFNNLGQLLIDANRSEEAIPILQQALAIAPDHPGSLYNIGLAYRKLGQAREAAEWFRKALTIDPNLTTAKNELAKVKYIENTLLFESTGVGDSTSLSGP